MILRIYNKLNSYREVGISEAISHFLGFSDHYIDKKFQHIHTIYRKGLLSCSQWEKAKLFTIKSPAFFLHLTHIHLTHSSNVRFLDLLPASPHLLFISFGLDWSRI